MTNPQNTTENNPQHDMKQWAINMVECGVKLQELSKFYLKSQQTKLAENVKNGEKSNEIPDLDPLNLGAGMLALSQSFMKNPSEMINLQTQLYQDYMNVWMQTSRRFMGLDSTPVINPDKDDKRFKSEEWNQNLIFDLIKQSYLVTVKATQNMVDNVDDIDEKSDAKLQFFTNQFLDAMSPTNFALTNPEVLKETMSSKGENLVKGVTNLLEDFKKGGGERVKISMTDATAFKLGDNIATTKGGVVYRNKLMELLQFSPSTEEVYKRPLLIMPPWINKYYILDLREKNSFLKWLTDQGFTVFCVSWVNPDEKLSECGFDDYMELGPFAALDAIKEITGESDIHAVGYCLGGTLLAATLAVMAAKGDKRIRSATFLTTMTDFKEPGDLGVFIDDKQLESLEEKMNEQGYLDGAEMATTFNLLRSNDLIWSFVINNYLLGKQPFPFDLLYWNSDSTRMPAKMHSYYLRKMYQENALVQKNALTLCGEKVDLTKIKTPSFFLSTREDHIAPWKSTYAAVNLYKGPIKFVLAGSGHIAGVINPPDPAKPKYGYWVNDEKNRDPEQWLESAEHKEGSWWPHWAEWLASESPDKVVAREIGGGKLQVLEAAPGSYVRVRV